MLRAAGKKHPRMLRCVRRNIRVPRLRVIVLSSCKLLLWTVSPLRNLCLCLAQARLQLISRKQWTTSNSMCLAFSPAPSTAGPEAGGRSPNPEFLAVAIDDGRGVLVVDVDKAKARLPTTRSFRITQVAPCECHRGSCPRRTTNHSPSKQRDTCHVRVAGAVLRGPDADVRLGRLQLEQALPAILARPRAPGAVSAGGAAPPAGAHLRHCFRRPNHGPCTCTLSPVSKEQTMVLHVRRPPT